MKLNIALIIAEEERKKREAEKAAQVPLYVPQPTPPYFPPEWKDRTPKKIAGEVDFYL